MERFGRSNLLFPPGLNIRPSLFKIVSNYLPSTRLSSHLMKRQLDSQICRNCQIQLLLVYFLYGYTAPGKPREFGFGKIGWCLWGIIRINRSNWFPIWIRGGWAQGEYSYHMELAALIPTSCNSPWALVISSKRGILFFLHILYRLNGLYNHVTVCKHYSVYEQ